MNEKDAPNPQPKRPPSFHAEIKAPSYPVKAIFFASPQNIDGKISGTSVTSNTERPPNRDHHWLEVVPSLHSFAVWWCRANQAPKLSYMPIALAARWEPF